MTKDEIMRLANDIANANSACTVAALTLGRDSQRYADCVEQLNKKLAALESAMTQQQEPVAWMVTTEMQDGTRSTYPTIGRYKDVNDICDFGNPVPLYAAPVAAQPVNQMLLEALKELLSEADDGIATSPLTRSKARAAIAAAEGKV